MRIAPNISQLGTETAFQVLGRATELAAQGRDIINLGIGQPDFPTPDNIVQAAQRALAEGHHGYTPANGILPLREAVAEDIRQRRRVEVNPDNLMIVPGGKVTMSFAIMMFGSPGAQIVYPDPGFPIYRSMIAYTGATPVPMRLHEDKGFAFDADEVLAQINHATRLIILNSPANPTGGVVPRAEMDKLVAGLEQFPHLAILSDEIYSRMTYDRMHHVSLLSYPSIRDRLIVLDGWSKTYAMTGWRLGWGLWPDELIELAGRMAVNMHSCVNAATQYAGIEALTGPQDAVDQMMEAFDERRRVIVDGLNSLPGVRCVRPQGAFYAFANIHCTGMTAREVQDGLLEDAGVATIAGTSFGNGGEGFVRFSYANSTENIEKAIEWFGDWLKTKGIG